MNIIKYKKMEIFTNDKKHTLLCEVILNKLGYCVYSRVLNYNWSIIIENISNDCLLDTTVKFLYDKCKEIDNYIEQYKFNLDDTLNHNTIIRTSDNIEDNIDNINFIVIQQILYFMSSGIKYLVIDTKNKSYSSDELEYLLCNKCIHHDKFITHILISQDQYFYVIAILKYKSFIIDEFPKQTPFGLLITIYSITPYSSSDILKFLTDTFDKIESLI